MPSEIAQALRPILKTWPKMPKFLIRPYTRAVLPDSSQPRQWIMPSKEKKVPKVDLAITNRGAPVYIYSMENAGLKPVKALDDMDAFERWYTPTVHKVLGSSNNSERTDIFMEINGVSREEAIPKRHAQMAAKVTGKQENAPAGQARAPSRGSKVLLIGAMLERPEGCTTAEILEATAWPSVSVPAQAKLAGLTLRKEKLPGQPTRYWGSK